MLQRCATTAWCSSQVSELTNDGVWKMLHPHRDCVGIRLPLREDVVDLIGTAIHEDPQPCYAQADKKINFDGMLRERLRSKLEYSIVARPELARPTSNHICDCSCGAKLGQPCSRPAMTWKYVHDAALLVIQQCILKLPLRICLHPIKCVADGKYGRTSARCTPQ